LLHLNFIHFLSLRKYNVAYNIPHGVIVTIYSSLTVQSDARQLNIFTPIGCIVCFHLFLVVIEKHCKCRYKISFLGSTVSPDNYTTNLTESIYDTYGYYIHPHWKQFPLIPAYYHYIVGIYITLVGISGIAGNSIVIWIFST
jgi:hypothetical protein